MNKKVLIIIIAVVLVGAAAAAFFLLQPKEVKQFYISPGDAFVTNVLDSDRLIKTSVVLLTNDDQTEFLGEHNSAVRDTILSVLRGTSETEYRDANLQTMLSDKIVAKLNEQFPPEEADELPKFAKVYFNDFVMQ